MSRGQIVMLIALLGLGAFYVFHDVKGGPKREEAATKAKRLFPELKKDEITLLTVERLKDEGTFKKFQRTIRHERGVWILDGPEPHMLSTSSTGTVMKSLAEVQKTEELSETPGAKIAPSEFGLDKPSFKITIKSKDGQTHTLTLGDKTPDGAGYYAQGTGAIERITTTLNELLENDPDKSRETSVIPFEPSRANKVVYSPAGAPEVTVALLKAREKSADDSPDDGVEITNLSEEWIVSPPSGTATPASKEPMPADGAKIRDSIWAWKNLKHTRFLTKADKIDFSHPAFKLAVYVDGETEPFSVEVGPPLPNQPRLRYVRRLKPDEVMLMDFPDTRMVEASPAKFEQRHLATFENDDVQRMSGKIGGTDLAAKHADNGWKVQQPTTVSGDETVRNTAISDLIWDLKNIEWSERVTDSKDWKERAKVSFFDKKDETLLEVSVGAVVDRGALVKVKDKIYRVEPDPVIKWESIMKRLSGAVVSPTPTPGTATPGPVATGTPAPVVPMPVPASATPIPVARPTP